MALIKSLSLINNGYEATATVTITRYSNTQANIVLKLTGSTLETDGRASVTFSGQSLSVASDNTTSKTFQYTGAGSSQLNLTVNGVATKTLPVSWAAPSTSGSITNLTFSTTTPKYNDQYTVNWTSTFQNVTYQRGYYNYNNSGPSSWDSSYSGAKGGPFQPSTIGNKYTYNVRAIDSYGDVIGSVYSGKANSKYVTITGYDVSYQVNGGSAISATTNVAYLPNPLPTPTYTGRRFDGWFTDSALTTAATPGNQISENTILYAKWTVTSYVINYNANTSDVVTGVPSATTKSATAAATLSSSVPQRTGYTFTGWKYGNNVYQAGATFSESISSDITLYAQWQINKYTITINASSGGSVSHSSISNVEYGTSISRSNNTFTVGSTTVTATPSASTETVSYVFSSWSNVPSSMPADNITVTANFTSTTLPVPQITNVTYNGYQYNTTSSNNCTLSVTPTIKANVACNVIVYLKINNNYYPCYNGVAQSITTTATALNTISINSTLAANNIVLNTAGTLTAFQVSVKLSSGGSYKDYATVYHYAPKCGLLGVYNNDYGVDVSAANASGKFYRDIYLYITRDNSVSSVSASCKVGNTNYSCTVAGWDIQNSTSTGIRMKLQLDPNLPNGSKPDITIGLNSDGIDKGFTFNLGTKYTNGRVNIISQSTPVLSLNEINFFEATSGNLSASIGTGTYTSGTIDGFNSYYSVSSASLSISNNASPGSGSIISGGSSSVSGNTYYYTVPLNNVYPVNGYGFNYYGKSTTYLTLTITNSFGYVLNIGVASLAINFNKAIVGGTIGLVRNANSGTVSYLHEGDVLKFTDNISYYTNEKITVALQVSVNNGTYRDYTQLYSNTPPAPTSRSAKTLAISNTITVPALADAHNRKFRLKIIGDITGTVYSSATNNITSYKHIAPTVTINNPTITNNVLNGLSFNASADYASGSTLTNTAILYTNGISKTKTLTVNNTGSTNLSNLNYLPTSGSGWNSASIYVVFTSKLTDSNGIISTKTATSNILLIYNNVPTVAYRTNKLGINVAELDHSDSVLEILPTSDHGMIYLGASGSDYVKIDLANKTVEGLLIDCGSWS